MSSPYDNFAKYYDGWFISPFLKAHHKQAINFISPYIKNNSSVLDIGCGTGAFLKQLVKKNKPSTQDFGELNRAAQAENLKIFGIDASSGMIKRALKKKIPNANFQIAQAEDIPFPNDYFDIITCVDSLYHLNPEKLFSECHRTLKPGGFIFIDTMSVDHRKIFTKISIFFTRIFQSWQKAKYLKFQEIETIAKANGFNTTRTQAKNYPYGPYYKSWLIIFQK